MVGRANANVGHQVTRGLHPRFLHMTYQHCQVINGRALGGGGERGGEEGGKREGRREEGRVGGQWNDVVKTTLTVFYITQT